MKVTIGNYINWVGPYQLSELTKPIIGKRLSDKLGDHLVNIEWFCSLCEKIHAKRKRAIKVKVHDYDVFSLDTTLAHIILPCLIKLKTKTQGSPFVDDSDLPEYMLSQDIHAKWNWVLDEMIWAFGNHTHDSDSQFFNHDDIVLGMSLNEQLKAIKIDKDALIAHNNRKSNGFRLFGKYYQALWT